MIAETANRCNTRRFLLRQPDQSPRLGRPRPFAEDLEHAGVAGQFQIPVSEKEQDPDKGIQPVEAEGKGKEYFCDGVQAPDVNRFME